MLNIKNLGLEHVGITHWRELHYNLSYDELYAHETGPRLKSFEQGVVTEFGAYAVDTGKFTGRSPKDKYIVEEETSKNHIWWASNENIGSDNKAISEHTWKHLKELTTRELNGKRLFVMDGFCGANPDSRLNVRIVTEVPWMAHFFKNMFIRPSDEELNNFKPDWTILNGCETVCHDFKDYGLRSEVYIAFNLKERMTVIGGTWYGGEIKKGIFSIMNYFLPLKGIGAFHCSANMGVKKDTALFFGLSGTGKTTLSTDPHRALIGDDEHGWDDEGIFNFEGGCYAKCIDLSPTSEPDIYNAIKRDALLENVEVDSAGKVDFTSKRKTENSRVSYPIYHIHNIVKPVSKGPHPTKIIFLTCDAYGVLPPVAKLTRPQAMYHYLSGYTAKIGGTELGVVEPKATFSACFGQAFLLLPPIKYADILGEKIEKHNATTYLVNTGWTGGRYGVGKRMSLENTRHIIDAILDGGIEESEFETLPVFNLQIPKALAGIDSAILNSRNVWKDKSEYDKTAHQLAQMFIENFKRFQSTQKGAALINEGPRLN